MSDNVKPYTLGDVPDEMTCTDCGEPDCCLMNEQSRIIATVEALEKAEARIRECEKACSMPLELIGTTLDAHRNVAEADGLRAEKAEAERDGANMKAALAEALRQDTALRLEECARQHTEARAAHAVMAEAMHRMEGQRNEARAKCAALRGVLESAEAHCVLFSAHPPWLDDARAALATDGETNNE